MGDRRGARRRHSPGSGYRGRGEPAFGTRRRRLARSRRLPGGQCRRLPRQRTRVDFGRRAESTPIRREIGPSAEQGARGAARAGPGRRRPGIGARLGGGLGGSSLRRAGALPGCAPIPAPPRRRTRDPLRPAPLPELGGRRRSLDGADGLGAPGPCGAVADRSRARGGCTPPRPIAARPSACSPTCAAPRPRSACFRSGSTPARAPRPRPRPWPGRTPSRSSPCGLCGRRHSDKRHRATAPCIVCISSSAPALCSGSFRLPHLGLCTHEGQPDSQGHSPISRSASPSRRSNSS